MFGAETKLFTSVTLRLTSFLLLLSWVAFPIPWFVTEIPFSSEIIVFPDSIKCLKSFNDFWVTGEISLLVLAGETSLFVLDGEGSCSSIALFW